MKKCQYLDKEEQALHESLEKEEWVSDLTQNDKEQYQTYAGRSIAKSRRINIRITERDLKKIQVKAIEEGIPYQTLISMLIHKFNRGELSLFK